MKEDSKLSQNYSKIKKEKRINGVFFGIFAGLGFSLAIWGYDALILFQSNTDLPWLKLLLGAPACMFLGAITGWIVARLDNGVLGFILWSLTGLAFVWIASHVPFNGQTFLIGCF